MKQIKFRVWNGKNMLMSENSEFYLMPNNKIQIPSSTGNEFYVRDYPIMQFTGLLDKNGKEIYEGDIVKGRYEYQDCFCDLIEEVKFCDCYFTPFGAWFGDGSGLLYSSSIDPKDFEIIGNIYEHSYLLVEEDDNGI